MKVMIVLIAALALVLPATAQTIPCKKSADCLPLHVYDFIWCSGGLCQAENLGKNCSGSLFECGNLRSCVNGTCQFGVTGAPCSTRLRNCMIGYACDALTKKCVPGVTGTTCRTTGDCGQGNSCFLEEPVARKKEERRGVCKPGLFNTWACTKDSQCATGLVLRKKMICVEGKCQPRNLGDRCQLAKYKGVPVLLLHELRQWQVCIPEGRRRLHQSKRYYTAPCSVGMLCDAPRNSMFGTRGKCVRGIEGMTCWDAHECEAGLICGTSRVCTKSAEGQRCLSNYWCPRRSVCRKSTKRCTFAVDSVPVWDRFPEVNRAPTCNLNTDCRKMYSPSCVNGLCLPTTLGWTCNSEPQNGASCVNGLVVEGAAGMPCKRPRHCLVGFTCVKGKCEKYSPAAICETDHNCPKGYYCGGYPFRCIKDGKWCRENAGCAQGMCYKDENLSVKLHSAAYSSSAMNQGRRCRHSDQRARALRVVILSVGHCPRGTVSVALGRVLAANAAEHTD
eukprot:IDg19099t1